MKAFPTTKPLDSWGDPNAGMDLRDYFAAKAMPLVMEMWNNHIRNNPGQDWGSPNIEMNDFDLIAFDSYEMADAMMKAREQ
jgi:hypothetical protein